MKMHKQWCKIITLIVTITICLTAGPVPGAVVTDEIGRKVAVPGRPERIVSLAPSITETLFALGLDRCIVGVTNYCNYPEGAKGIPRVGGFINLSLERIAALQPDLIIATADGNRKETVRQLQNLGFEVYVVNPSNIDEIFISIQGIGRITGRTEASESLVAKLKQRVNTVIQRTARLPKPRVFFQVGSDPIVTVGSDTFLDELIALAGGVNVGHGQGIKYPRYSIEGVIASAPDIIVVAPMDKRSKDFHRIKKGWQRWRSIPAVANGRIFRIDPDRVNRSSPRIVDALEELSRMFHPEPAL
ncbi:MAG: cobalamin-binding protein [Deltaproteobacteria bacterium]|nr:cobalamin-binding protein [Deltaproteobacteria bacterium]